MQTITVRLSRLFPETRSDVGLQLAQCGRFQSFEVDFDLFGVEVFERLARLDNLYNATETLA